MSQRSVCTIDASATNKKSSFLQRTAGFVPGGKLLPLFATVVLVAGTVFGAVTVTYLTDSDVALRTTTAPVVYQAGDDTSSRYVSGWALSSNATSFDVTVKGVPEANLTIGSLFKIHNQDTVAHSLTLTLDGGVVSNAFVTALKIEFNDAADDSRVSVWDLRSSATHSLAAMAASKTYYATVWVELATGAGNHNVAEDLSVGLSVA